MEINTSRRESVRSEIHRWTGRPKW